MASTRVKQPGKRALRVQVEARRAELERGLLDLLRALGLGAKTLPGLVELLAADDEPAALALLGQFAGKTMGDQRRIAGALGAAKEIAALPRI